MSDFQSGENAIVLGVIADTHIPDRRKKLDDRILPLFKERNVQAILHAGDISAPSVLQELAQIAPVYAVRGNRDWGQLKKLPLALDLCFADVPIGITHGHGGLFTYLTDRPIFMLRGYYHERLFPRLIARFPKAKVIVFGHGHLALNQWKNGQLFFNPGSPHFPTRHGVPHTLGFLHLYNKEDVRGEIIQLE